MISKFLIHTVAPSCGTPPPARPNGKAPVVTMGTEGKYGSVVEYKCEPGYQIVHGSPINICLLDGNYKFASAPSCEGIGVLCS